MLAPYFSLAPQWPPTFFILESPLGTVKKSDWDDRSP